MAERAGLWYHAASFALLIALWQAASGWLDSQALPPPLAVLEVLIAGIGDGEIPYHVGITLARVAVSFLIAMSIGVALGLLMGRQRWFDRLFDGWLILFLNIPALVTIILLYVWLGLVEIAAIAAVAINKIPNVVVTIREGARALERDYLEMAQVYRLGRLRTIRHVMLPQLFPYVIAAARSGLALIWKIVLVVELLGRGDGVGFQLYTYFQLFDVASILAYTFAFVAAVQVIELAGLQPLERRVNRWRR
ncbi:MAG TPA: ABC transporter permease [Kiloniellales bacterium]|nr:ABC transporter permease [Kiloniellales bacterium]